MMQPGCRATPNPKLACQHPRLDQGPATRRDGRAEVVETGDELPLAPLIPVSAQALAVRIISRPGRVPLRETTVQDMLCQQEEVCGEKESPNPRAAFCCTIQFLATRGRLLLVPFKRSSKQVKKRLYTPKHRSLRDRITHSRCDQRIILSESLMMEQVHPLKAQRD